MRGGSAFTALIETETGGRHLLKLSGSASGPRGLLSELLASCIAASLDVPLPAVRPLYLPPGFPWQVGTDEFDEMLQRSYGWNLGLAYLPDARVATAVDLGRLPGGFLFRLERADRLLQNVDRTGVNPNVLIDAGGQPWAIDYGACLFLQRIVGGAKLSFALPAGHFLHDARKRDATTLPARVPSRNDVRAWLGECPRTWLESVPLSPPQLEDQLCRYFEEFLRSRV
jgi:hypothetical protein